MTQNIFEINTNAPQESSLSPLSSPLKTDTYYNFNKNIIENRVIGSSKLVESSIDFILSHFEEPIFPRKISTYKSQNNGPFQFTVRSRKEIVDSFIESCFVDCQINAYASLTEYKDVPRYKPEFLFIDIDRSNFVDDKSFERVLSKTLKNIKDKLSGYPTVLFTGGGYHIYQPVYCPTALENIIEFQEFDKPSEQFLRFAKDYLSNGKADKQNNPSFKSCLIRLPGSIRSKYNNNRPVRIIQEWNGVRPNITKEIVEEFRSWLIQKKIDERIQRQKIDIERSKNKNRNKINLLNYYTWIENLIQIPIEDYRKLVVELILVPYLILVKRLSNEQTFSKVNQWLQKCALKRQLDFNPKFRINSAIKISLKKQIPPMSYNRLRENYRDLYYLIYYNKKNDMNDNNSYSNTNNIRRINY